MRALALIAGLLMIVSCYAYQIDLENLTNETQKQITQESLKLQEKLDARLPATSKATAGTVSRRKVELSNFSYPLFIIGDDAFSHQWLKDHAQELEKINAIGFITNIDNSPRLQEMQQLIKAPLLPANVDDLLAIFKVGHYPLIFHEGELWQ